MRNFTNLSSYLKPSTACRRIKSRDCIQSTKYLFSPILECSILKEKVKTISGNNSNCSFAIVSNKSPITITFNSFTIRILPTFNSWRSWDCLSILCSGSYRKFNEFRVGSIHICNDFQREGNTLLESPSFLPFQTCQLMKTHLLRIPNVPLPIPKMVYCSHWPIEVFLSCSL